MGTYVTIASVRRTCGILQADISDTDVEAIITEVEPQVERFYNTVFTPKQRIDILDGNGTYRIILDKNPVLAVRELRIDGDDEDTAHLHVARESGKIELNSDSTNSTFLDGTNKIVIRYIYGFVEESSTSTTTSAAEIAGTNVSIAVGSITGFTNGDWVEIYGIDGFKEAAQINAVPGAGAIQVDELVYTHEAGSTVVKLEASQTVKKLMNLACSIACVARIIGQSYTDIVGYGLGELNVQKGEPYTQWRETAHQLITERDMIMNAIKPRPYIC
jgi:hypothetical protein